MEDGGGRKELWLAAFQREGTLSLLNTGLGRTMAAQGRRPAWVAEQAGTNENSLRRWGYGLASPDLATQERLAAILEVPIEDLFPEPGAEANRILGRARRAQACTREVAA